jgi:kinesin family member 5
LQLPLRECLGLRWALPGNGRHSGGMAERRTNERVFVHCRMRPSAAHVVAAAGSGGAAIGAMDPASNTLEFIKRPSASEGVIPGQPPPEPKVLKYQFDSLLPPSSRQDQVYDTVARPIVQDVLRGYNGTVLAYGQTGTGKTHTMFGPPDAVDALASSEASVELVRAFRERSGITPRALDEIFATAETAPEAGESISVCLAYVQIYVELVHDLLAEDPTSKTLSVREDPSEGVWLDGVTWHTVKSTADALSLLLKGHQNRAVASTRLNSHSSRSHAVLILRVDRRVPLKTPTADSTHQLLRGTLHLVDLAGSERAKRSGVEGIHLEELKAINLSLSALGNCIAALAKAATPSLSSTRPRPHVPYRDSKLTRLLQDSLGGNAKTSLVITVTDEEASANETHSTLQFGSRARRVVVRARVNAVKDWKAMFEALQRRVDSEEDSATGWQMEAQRLKKALQDERTRRERLERQASADRHKATSMEAMFGADATGDATTLGKRFESEVEAMRNECDLAVKRAEDMSRERVAELEGRLADVITAKNDLEYQLGGSREEVLEVLRNFRETQKRLAETEDGLESRVAELVSELEDERRGRQEADDRAEAAESAMRSMVERVRSDFVSRKRVAEMEDLYRHAINQLQSRVEALESQARETAAVVGGISVVEERMRSSAVELPSIVTAPRRVISRPPSGPISKRTPGSARSLKASESPAASRGSRRAVVVPTTKKTTLKKTSVRAKR